MADVDDPMMIMTTRTMEVIRIINHNDFCCDVDGDGRENEIKMFLFLKSVCRSGYRDFDYSLFCIYVYINRDMMTMLIVIVALLRWCWCNGGAGGVVRVL